MPKVSIIIPTHNRPDLIGGAVRSVFAQTYQDWELIVVDVGLKERAKEVLHEYFSDPRFRYIESPQELPGGAARNVGAQQAKGEYLAFLDDDDEWVHEKLALQMEQFLNASEKVGFSFTGATLCYETKEVVTHVKEGVHDFYQIALLRFKGFLTVTLVIKKEAFLSIGGFDEQLPSHQDPELILRLTKKWLGLGIDRPLTRVNAKTRGDSIGGNLTKRILGREMLIEKHKQEYLAHPKALAKHYFWLGLWCRDAGQQQKTKEYFRKAFLTFPHPRYFLHWIFQSQYARLCIGLLFGGFLLTLLFSRIDFSVLSHLFIKGNHKMLLFAPIFIFFGHFFSILRWKVLLRVSGYDVPFSRLSLAFFANLPAAKFFPSYSGDLLRVLYVGNMVPHTFHLGVIFLEAMMDVAVLLSFIVLGAIFFSTTTTGIFLFFLFLLALLFLFHADRIFQKLLNYFPRFKETFVALSLLRKHPRNTMLLFLFTALAWLATIFFIVTLFSAFGVSVGIGYVFFVQPLVTFLSLLPISVGGIGIREGAMIFFYAPFASSATIFLVGAYYSFVSILLFPLFSLPCYFFAMHRLHKE